MSTAMQHDIAYIVAYTYNGCNIGMGVLPDVYAQHLRLIACMHKIAMPVS